MAEMVRHTLIEDGARRNLRPDRRRIPSLQRRRAMAGAAFRKNALRQRAAGASLPRRRPRAERAGVPGRRARNPRLRSARDDESRGRLLRRAGRRQRGRGRKVFRLDARAGRRGARSRAGAIAERYFDITIEGNFEDANIPHRTIELADAARMFKVSEDDMAAKIREIRDKAVRGARTKGEARPRRKNPGGVERDDDRRIRGGISRAA